jgi:hypothetical protein
MRRVVTLGASAVLAACLLVVGAVPALADANPTSNGTASLCDGSLSGVVSDLSSWAVTDPLFQYAANRATPCWQYSGILATDQTHFAFPNIWWQDAVQAVTAHLLPVAGELRQYFHHGAGASVSVTVAPTGVWLNNDWHYQVDATMAVASNSAATIHITSLSQPYTFVLPTLPTSSDDYVELSGSGIAILNVSLNDPANATATATATSGPTSTATATNTPGPTATPGVAPVSCLEVRDCNWTSLTAGADGTYWKFNNVANGHTCGFTKVVVADPDASLMSCQASAFTFQPVTYPVSLTAGDYLTATVFVRNEAAASDQVSLMTNGGTNCGQAATISDTSWYTLSFTCSVTLVGGSYGFPPANAGNYVNLDITTGSNTQFVDFRHPALCYFLASYQTAGCFKAGVGTATPTPVPPTPAPTAYPGTTGGVDPVGPAPPVGAPAPNGANAGSGQPYTTATPAAGSDDGGSTLSSCTQITFPVPHAPPAVILPSGVSNIPVIGGAVNATVNAAVVVVGGLWSILVQLFLPQHASCDLAGIQSALQGKLALPSITGYTSQFSFSQGCGWLGWQNASFPITGKSVTFGVDGCKSPFKDWFPVFKSFATWSSWIVFAAAAYGWARRMSTGGDGGAN